MIDRRQFELAPIDFVEYRQMFLRVHQEGGARVAGKCAVPGIERYALADGRWGSNPAKSDTTKALRKFQEIAHIPVTNTVGCNDTTVLHLADEADILIVLSGRSGYAGILDFNTAVKDITYEPKAGPLHAAGLGCIFYGVEGLRGYAVQLRFGDDGSTERIQPGPVYLNCTTYANLAMSIYVFGDAHNPSYLGNLINIGHISDTHLPQRYMFPLMVRKTDKEERAYFKTAAEISECVKPDKLYGIECGGRVAGEYGAVYHEAILYGGTVYDAFPLGSAPTVKPHTLKDFIDERAGSIFYLFQEQAAGVDVFGPPKAPRIRVSPGK